LFRSPKSLPMDVHVPSVASLSSRSIWSSRSVSFIVSLHEVLYFGVDFLDEEVGVDHVIVFAIHVVESGDDFLGFTKRTNSPALFGSGYDAYVGQRKPTDELFFCVCVQCAECIVDIGCTDHLSERRVFVVSGHRCLLFRRRFLRLRLRTALSPVGSGYVVRPCRVESSSRKA